MGGQQLEGPALVEEGDTVIVVPPGSTLVHRHDAQPYVLQLPSTPD